MVLPSLLLGRVMEAAGPRSMMTLLLLDPALDVLAFAGMLRLRPAR